MSTMGNGFICILRKLRLLWNSRVLMCGTTLVKSTAEKKEETLSKGIATTRWQLGPSAGQSVNAECKLGNGVIPCKMKNFTSWI